MFTDRKIKVFWNWFVDNVNSYERTDVNFSNMHQSHDDSATLHLLKQVQKIDKKLHIAHWLYNEKNTQRQLIISANGNLKKFALVKKIVERAPAIKGWEAIAFRPRIDESDLTMYLNGHHGVSDDEVNLYRNTPFEAGLIMMQMVVQDNNAMSVDKMYYDIEIVKNKIHINVYGNGLGKYTTDSVHETGMIFIQYVLGEYNALMKVHKFSFYGLDCAHDFSELKPLTELHKYVETLPDKN